MDEEQRLFRRLSVFAGGCTLGAAETVAQSDLDTLQSLIEKSLARRTGERYWMLETIREFGLERLDESGEADEVRQRHAEYFLRLAEEAEPHLGNPPEQRRWLERVDAEHNNVRAALAWSSDGGDADLGLRLAASLREFWFVRGYYSEGLGWLDSLLERRVTGDQQSRLRALEAASELAARVDEVDPARYAEDALALARDAGDTLAVARSLLALSFKARFAGETERRDALYFEELTEGLALAREAGDFVLAARFLATFGTAALEAGDFGRARRFHRESLAMCEEAESEQGIARASIFLAGVALYEGGQVEDAYALYRRGLRLAHRLGWTEAVVYALGGLACADAELGQSERAAKLVGAESRLVEEVHLRIWRFQHVLRERAAAALRRELDAERLDRLLAEGRAMSLDEGVAIALDEAD